MQITYKICKYSRHVNLFTIYFFFFNKHYVFIQHALHNIPAMETTRTTLTY